MDGRTKGEAKLPQKSSAVFIMWKKVQRVLPGMTSQDQKVRKKERKEGAVAVAEVKMQRVDWNT